MLLSDFDFDDDDFLSVPITTPTEGAWRIARSKGVYHIYNIDRLTDPIEYPDLDPLTAQAILFKLTQGGK